MQLYTEAQCRTFVQMHLDIHLTRVQEFSDVLKWFFVKFLHSALTFEIIRWNSMQGYSENPPKRLFYTCSKIDWIVQVDFENSPSLSFGVWNHTLKLNVILFTKATWTFLTRIENAFDLSRWILIKVLHWGLMYGNHTLKLSVVLFSKLISTFVWHVVKTFLMCLFGFR